MCVSCVDTLEFDYNTNGKFSLFADEDFVQSFLPVENATDALVENRVVCAGTSEHSHGRAQLWTHRKS